MQSIINILGKPNIQYIINILEPNIQYSSMFIPFFVEKISFNITKYYHSTYLSYFISFILHIYSIDYSQMIYHIYFSDFIVDIANKF